jgi:rhamnulokinase
MSVLALDLGASNGRAFAAELRADRVELTLVHRFANEPVAIGERLYWDFPLLWSNIGQSVRRACASGCVDSLGVDAWGLDFGLLDEQGELLGHPYHYRDSQTIGMLKHLWSLRPAEDIFERTGVQFMPVNTIVQLLALSVRKPGFLDRVAHLQMIPDLIRFFLTGVVGCEYTIATTTQMVDIQERTWSEPLVRLTGLSMAALAAIEQPGVKSERIRSDIASGWGVPAIPVLAVAEHDTASAVLAVPAASEHFVFVSCGTWALVGSERAEPLRSPEVRVANFSNEGGVGNTTRLLKNVTGLWVLQCVLRELAAAGMPLDPAHAAQLAAERPPSAAWFDPDDDCFSRPQGSVLAVIRSSLEVAGADTLIDTPAVLRCVFDSLALKIALVVRQLATLTGTEYDAVHVIGGGARIPVLCQDIADAVGAPVVAGPAEASATGNAMMQFMARGEVRSVRELRQLVGRSTSILVYHPAGGTEWAQRRGEYESMLDVATARKRAVDPDASESR